MLTFLLEKIGIKTGLYLAGTFLLFWIAFGSGWYFCNLKHDAQYKNQYSILIDKINESENNNKKLSVKHYDNLSEYRNKLNNVNTRAINEDKASNFNNSCIIPPGSMQQINNASAITNKIRSS